ncbi:MAG: MerR family transcriptional regulator [Velocimicrobium sp.]
MNIKALSKLSDTPISTIRYYERCGLLPIPNRLANNYRDYDELAVQYLNFIRYMNGLGFSLHRTKEVIHHIEDGSINKTYIMSMLACQNEKIQNQLEQLQTLKEVVNTISSQTNEIDDFLEFVYPLFL